MYNKQIIVQVWNRQGQRHKGGQCLQDKGLILSKPFTLQIQTHEA